MMKSIRLNVEAHRSFQLNAIELLFSEQREFGALFAAPLVMQERDRTAEHIEPTVVLRLEEAQALADELWRCGIRPSEAAGSVGAMAAVERHLQDMRAIAGGLLKQHEIDLGVKR